MLVDLEKRNAGLELRILLAWPWPKLARWFAAARRLSMLGAMVGFAGCSDGNTDPGAGPERDGCVGAMCVGAESSSDRSADDIDASSDLQPTDAVDGDGIEGARERGDGPDLDSSDAFDSARDSGDGSAIPDPDAGDAADSPTSDDGGDGAATQCHDGVQDGTETDIDCGGACGACDVDRGCAVNSDCLTDSCVAELCALASGPPNWLKMSDMPKVWGPLKAAVMTYGYPWGKMVVTSAASPTTGYATFDFKTLTWSTAKLPAPRTMQAMTADLSGRVYLVGGDVGIAWSFDGAWNTSLGGPTLVHNDPGAATGSDGLLYILGGSASSTSVSSVETYDGTGYRWTLSPQAMPTARDSLSAVTIGPRIYAIGGHADAPQSHALATVEAYDVKTNTWSACASLPEPLVGFGASAGPDGRIYVAGGSENLPTDRVLAYTPASDRWTPIASLARARTDVAAATAPDGHIYVVGDALSSGSPVEVYGPIVGISPSTFASRFSTILMTGSNFAANATVRVYLGPPSTGTVLKTAKSTVTGALIPSITFTLPNVPLGAYVITVVDDRSRFPITLSLTII
jgi:hypothetical protein